MLTVVDEYSPFSFAFPCKYARFQTVISYLSQLFSTFGMPNFVHSDRGASFMSHGFKTSLHSKGVATSRTTPYNSTGNSQGERYNQTIWRTVRLFLRDKNLNYQSWHLVLQDAFHSIRSLLCTSTYTAPHEQFFVFSRRSILGKSVPSWLTTPGPVLLHRFVRSKSDPLCDQVELIKANQSYAHTRHPDGRETTMSLMDLAPCPQASGKNTNVDTSVLDDHNSFVSDSSEKSTDTSKPAGNSKNLDVSLDRSSENVDRSIENLGENRSSEIAQFPTEHLSIQPSASDTRALRRLALSLTAFVLNNTCLQCQIISSRWEECGHFVALLEY